MNTTLKLGLGGARKKRWKLPLVFVLGLVCSKAFSAQIIDLNELGGVESYAESFNNSGQICGEFWAPEPHRYHAFFYNNGKFKDINPVFASESFAYSISSNGIVAGAYYDETHVIVRAFIWQDGTFTTIPVPNSDDTLGNGVNKLGQVVGQMFIPKNRLNNDSQPRAFIFWNGVVQDLNLLLPANSGWLLTEAVKIDDEGKILGRGIHNGLVRDWILTLP